MKSTTPAAAAGGVVNVRVVPSWFTVNSPAPSVTPPKCTDPTVPSRVPVMVTEVPPVVGPDAGPKVVIVGGRAVMTSVPAT